MVVCKGEGLVMQKWVRVRKGTDGKTEGWLELG